MVKVNEYTAEIFTRIIRWKKLHFWNLYNPQTKQILKKSDLHKKGIPYFTDRKYSDKYGVIDLSGREVKYNLLWLQRLENYFNEGWILCAVGSNPLLIWME